MSTSMTPDRNRYPRSGHVLVAMIVSIAIWAVMVFWSLAYLRRISGGLEPFDLRPFGYDVAEARAFLAALSQLGRDYYLNTQLALDNAYPFTYALSRALLLLWLTIPGRLSDRPLATLARAALAALPIATAACDYVENDAITKMLVAGPQVDAETVAWASFWTQAKSLAGLVTEGLAVILGVTVFHRWWQRRYSGR
jgi:hypothetical protein